MVDHSPPMTEDEKKIRRARRMIEVDRMKEIIETRCLSRYMTKFETAAYLYIEEGREPAYTELVWEELEKQNPEFFKTYNVLIVIKNQIGLYNELLVHQKNAMNQKSSNTDPSSSTSAHISNQNFPNANVSPTGVPSVSLPTVAGSTSAHVSNQNMPTGVATISLPNGNTPAYVSNGNMQPKTFNTAHVLNTNNMNPDMYPPNSGDMQQNTINTSAHVLNTNNMIHNIYPPNTVIYRPISPNQRPQFAASSHFRTMNPSRRMHPSPNDGMNFIEIDHPRMQSNGTNFTPRLSTPQTIIRTCTPFDGGMQDVDHTVLDNLNAPNSSFPLESGMDVNGILNGGLFSEVMLNDRVNAGVNAGNDTQGEM